MAREIAVTVEGLKDVMAGFDGLKKSLRTSILRTAATKAARLLAKAAKARVKNVRTGQLKRSIGSWTKTTDGGWNVTGFVGPRKGFELARGKRTVDPRYYGHFIEGGVKPHAVGKGSRLRKGVQKGRMHPGFPAHSFLHAAYESLKSQLRDLMVSEIQKGIEKAAAKAKKKKRTA